MLSVPSREGPRHVTRGARGFRPRGPRMTFTGSADIVTTLDQASPHLDREVPSRWLGSDLTFAVGVGRHRPQQGLRCVSRGLHGHKKQVCRRPLVTLDTTIPRSCMPDYSVSLFHLLFLTLPPSTPLDAPPGKQKGLSEKWLRADYRPI